MPPEAVFVIAAALAVAAHWLARNFTPKFLGEWGPLILNAAAVVLAIGASATLADIGWLNGVLNSIAGLGTWPALALGVIAFIVPIFVLLILAPASWCKKALSLAVLLVFLLAVPLQAYAMPNGLGAFGQGLTSFMANLASPLTQAVIA